MLKDRLKVPGKAILVHYLAQGLYENRTMIFIAIAQIALGAAVTLNIGFVVHFFRISSQRTLAGLNN